MQRILLIVVAALGLTAGCYHQGDVGVGYSVGYAAPAPSLYYVSPGVSVVAYSDDPVFYSDNYYWRYDGGLWYRSTYAGGGWVVWHDVPHRVRTIDRPYRYARYQPNPRWQPNRGAYVRDQRTYNRGYQPAYRPGPPAVRDQRTYRAPAPRQQPVYQAPAARDHRSRPAPTHRAPAPAAPTVRDHRR
jgi:hypothetical protein